MKRILFVDDDLSILQGINRMLHSSRNQWEIEFAGSGEIALEAFERKEFDVVVSDIRMPGMDGATLLSEIQRRFPSAARIVLSGYSETDVAMRAAASAHQFLAKPCDANGLKSAIERVCTLQDLMTDPNLRRIVGEIGQLPSLSKAYISLREAVDKPNTSMARLADIVETDIAMAAKVLQLVNSAFFGLGQTVTSLRTAVNYLGLDTIKNLVLVAETFRAFTPAPGIPASVCDSIQVHGQRTAEIASKLPLEPRMRELTVVASLLHDVGTLVIASKMPKQFLAVTALAKKRACCTFEAEEELLGTSHAEVGAYLLGLWGIPKTIVEAVAHHHRPTRIPHAGFDSAAALYVAHVLAHDPVSAEQLCATELGEYDRRCFQDLGLTDRLSEFRQLTVTA